MEKFFINISTIKPSQIFLNQAKINRLKTSFQPKEYLHNDPLPIKRLDNNIIFTDGHTRAYFYYINGISEIPVYWDEDELDLELYRACVEMCRDLNIGFIGDLQTRILPDAEYQVKWVRECQRLSEKLRVNSSPLMCKSSID